MEHISAEQLKMIFTNPFYCLHKIDPVFCKEHDPLVSEEEWIKVNTQLISEIGAEKWLSLLLENLKGNYVKG
jgi:hypothetical protein